jgi:hypothetical protein
MPSLLLRDGTMDTSGGTLSAHSSLLFSSLPLLLLLLLLLPPFVVVLRK